MSYRFENSFPYCTSRSFTAALYTDLARVIIILTINLFFFFLSSSSSSCSNTTLATQSFFLLFIYICILYVCSCVCTSLYVSRSPISFFPSLFFLLSQFESSRQLQIRGPPTRLSLLILLIEWSTLRSGRLLEAIPLSSCSLPNLKVENRILDFLKFYYEFL